MLQTTNCQGEICKENKTGNKKKKKKISKKKEEKKKEGRATNHPANAGNVLDFEIILFLHFFFAFFRHCSVSLILLGFHGVR